MRGAREECGGRGPVKLIVEVFKPNDPIVAPRRPIDSSARNPSGLRLGERNAKAIWAARPKDWIRKRIECCKVRTRPSHTAGRKQQEGGRHSETKASAQAGQLVESARPRNATRSDRRAVGEQVGCGRRVIELCPAEIALKSQDPQRRKLPVAPGIEAADSVISAECRPHRSLVYADCGD